MHIFAGKKNNLKMYIYYFFSKELAEHCTHEQQIVGANLGSCRLLE